MADVISVNNEGILSLQAGIMKITARQNEVSLVDREMSQEIKKHLAKSDAALRDVAAKPEIDLRGMQTDEAIPLLERFLDSAQLANLNTVMVIHGKGTGTLRQAVHQCLKRERRVKSFRLGRYGEGEDGVTIVEV
jgi:DNA mismatch repair protein MutS2